jgi:hypothetical protein
MKKIQNHILMPASYITQSHSHACELYNTTQTTPIGNITNLHVMQSPRLKQDGKAPAGIYGERLSRSQLIMYKGSQTHHSIQHWLLVQDHAHIRCLIRPKAKDLDKG